VARRDTVDVKMANIQIALNEVSKTIMKQVVKVIADVAPRHNVSDVDAFTQEMLSALGFGESEKMVVEKAVKTKVAKPKKEPKEPSVDGSVEESEGGKSSGRKRVVSKKMKESFMAMEGATEEKLKEAMKAYKEAVEVDSFDALSREMLGLAVAEVVEKKAKAKKEPKEPKEKKAKKPKDESGRFTPNTTSRKLFKTIVEESGGDWKTVLECNLVKFIEDLSEEQFASASIQGHMRAYVATLLPAAPVVAAGGGGGGSARDAKAEMEADSEKEADEDDEDMEEFTFDGEELLIGVTSGKIYQHTAEAGDVLVGVAGKGRFKKVSKPKA
jgi:hypothetical protein